MPTREDFEAALALAQKDYQEKDPQAQAEKVGASWVPPGEEGRESALAIVPFLKTPYEIRGPGGEVFFREGEKEPALWEKILLLHYYNTASGEPLSQQLMSFQEIPDGRLYVPNFEKRAVSPLLDRFGRQPEEVWEAAHSLGGRRADPGDFSVTVPVFPRVPVTLIFWRGDEEFPPRLNVLFDRTVEGYLPTEDIILATQMMAFRLIGLAGKLQKG